AWDKTDRDTGFNYVWTSEQAPGHGWREPRRLDGSDESVRAIATDAVGGAMLLHGTGAGITARRYTP
nr:hypothetical protein [Myxococcota bacterium]